MNLTFAVDRDFMPGVERLSKLLGFGLQGGVRVTAQAADENGVTLAGDQAVIRYTKKHQFFRQLGVLYQRAGQGDFVHRDDGHFTELSMMLDASRGAAPTVDTVCRMIDYLALMGYSMAMLYTEDVLELENYPYFGWMRGRYTPDELRAMDDYAWMYGIELIPCLECYGHMGKYLRWSAADGIRDTAEVLLAREEETFRFLEDMLTQVTACFRSNRVHIGMDEAWDMGRGAFLDKHGYVPPFEIFSEYMERLIAITDRLGLKPMMWSDMYFRVCAKGNAYYDEQAEVSPEVASRIPQGVELVFWHYGEQPHCDGYMLRKHQALGREVIYAGGLWSWIGHFPEHNYMMETVRFSLSACRENGVRRAMQTLWLNDNGECPLFANLFGLMFFAEMCYQPNLKWNELSARFAATCGGDWDAFYHMSLYHNRFEGETFPNFHDRFFGKPLFYQDLMEGLYDLRLWERPMSEHYAACADRMPEPCGEWGQLYGFARLVFDYLSKKCRIHERLVPAYKADDRETLARIAREEIPALAAALEKLYQLHRTLWHEQLKPFGWRGLDDRYGGLMLRCDTAARELERYLSGEIPTLPQLDEPRLRCSLGGFARYTRLVI